MAEVHWHGNRSVKEFDGRPYMAYASYTTKEEADRLAKSKKDARYVRVVKRLSMPSMRGRTSYVYVVYVSTDLKPIRIWKRRT
ncbi:MAG: hypothetical protein WC489_06190 [Patescibacteria group bacterium]|jgi:hypothetical protein